MRIERLRQSPGALGRRLWRSVPYGRKYAFLATFVLGLLTHLYIFTNLILNADGALHLNDVLESTASGRWSQAVLTNLSGTMNAPWINGILSLLYLSLAVALLVDLFDIRSRLYITLLAAAMATFPTMTTVYAYIYTADGILCVLLLNVLGAWLVRRSRWGFLPGVLCMTVSMGLYQSYLSFAAALFILLLALDLLRPEETFRRVLLRGLWYVLAMAVSLALYFVILGLVMRTGSHAFSGYQGVDNMAAITPDKLPGLVAGCYTHFFSYFWRQSYGIFPRALRWMHLLLLAGSLVSCAFLVARHGLHRRPLPLALFVALLALFPLAANTVYILLPTGAMVYNLMLFPMAMATVLCIVLLYRVDLDLRGAAAGPLSNRARFPVTAVCWLQIVLLALVSYNNFVETNATYVKAEVELRQTMASSAALCEAIESAPGYTPGTPVVLIGYRAQEAMFPELMTDPYFFGFRYNWDIFLYFNVRVYLGKDINAYGVDLAALDAETRQVVEEMPVYPAEGSTVSRDGVLYMKVGDIGEDIDATGVDLSALGAETRRVGYEEERHAEA